MHHVILYSTIVFLHRIEDGGGVGTERVEYQKIKHSFFLIKSLWHNRFIHETHV